MVRIFFIWLEHASCLVDFAKIGCYCLLTLQHVLCINRNMPRVYKSTLGSRSYAGYSVKALDNALSDIQTKVLMQRQASVKYNIPRSTLKNKLKGVHGARPVGTMIFTQEEEEMFKAYVFTTSAYRFPVDMFDLRWSANTPVQKQHKDLTTRFTSNIKCKRAEISPTVIDEYFANLSKELEGVAAGNIWNYDETNLTDEPGQKRVLTKHGCKYPERVMNSTKSSTSCHHGMAPPYLSTYCKPTSSHGGRCHLRSAESGQLTVPRTRTNYGD